MGYDSVFKFTLRFKNSNPNADEESVLALIFKGLGLYFALPVFAHAGGFRFLVRSIGFVHQV
jgi:hypothetical protein